MDLLVLKGGSALDIIHRVSGRASIDIDLSLNGNFPFSNEEASIRLKKCLDTTFIDKGLRVFDYSFREVPPILTDDFRSFWGGFQVTFKLIEDSMFSAEPAEHERMRREALMIGNKGQFQIDISKHELCDGKMHADLDGFRVAVYTPEMIVAEKLRAICQQDEIYGNLLKKEVRQRARDFVDIDMIREQFRLDLSCDGFGVLLSDMFKAKHVPLRLLGNVCKYREFHRIGFASVGDTIRVGTSLHAFDYYFERVEALCEDLKPFWDI